jgi:hypothetical protein
MYFDSGSATPKNYTNIKNILDHALNRHYLKGKGFKKVVTLQGRHVFRPQIGVPLHQETDK